MKKDFKDMTGQDILDWLEEPIEYSITQSEFKQYTENKKWSHFSKVVKLSKRLKRENNLLHEKNKEQKMKAILYDHIREITKAKRETF